jgi:hypothetical protein
MEVLMHRKLGIVLTAWLLATAATLVILRSAGAAGDVAGVAPHGQHAMEVLGRGGLNGPTVVRR